MNQNMRHSVFSQRSLGCCQIANWLGFEQVKQVEAEHTLENRRIKSSQLRENKLLLGVLFRRVR